MRGVIIQNWEYY